MSFVRGRSSWDPYFSPTALLSTNKLSTSLQSLSFVVNHSQVPVSNSKLPVQQTGMAKLNSVIHNIQQSKSKVWNGDTQRWEKGDAGIVSMNYIGEKLPNNTFF